MTVDRTREHSLSSERDSAEEYRSSLLALVRVLLIVPVTAIGLIIQGLLSLTRCPGYKLFPHLYHKIACKILGFRIITRGQRTKEHPTLFVANHVSYWDISILGAALTKTSFIAKAEIANWGVFGWMAKFQRSVFIDRRVSRTLDHRNSVAERLQAGDDLILFPEGTSDDGTFVLPFKSSLFAISEESIAGVKVAIQPLSIAYTRLDNLPLGRCLRPYFAWFGDMELLSHLWYSLGLGYLTVEITFHDPVYTKDFSDRKTLAAYCHCIISKGLSESLYRRSELKTDEVS